MTEDIVRPGFFLETKAFAEYDSWAPIMFGGAPHLPPEISWPRDHLDQPFHFFAQLDLSALAESMQHGVHEFCMPAHPSEGTVFLFLPLTENGLVNGQASHILFHPGTTQHFPAQRPPPDTPQMDEDAQVVDLDSIMDCGQMLRRRHVAPRPTLTHFDANPLLMNMQRRLTTDESYEKERAYADELAEYGIHIEIAPPLPEAVRDPDFDKLPLILRKFLRRGQFQWTWEYIFEFAKRMAHSLHDLPVRELERAIKLGDDHPKYQYYINRAARRQSKIMDEQFHKKTGLGQWLMYRDFHKPPFYQNTVDWSLHSWMFYAKQQRDRPLSDHDKAAFAGLIDRIDAANYHEKPADLQILAGFSSHNASGWDVYMHAMDAFEAIAKNRTDLHPDRQVDETKLNFGEKKNYNPQVFGFGYLLQHAAGENIDKVLLLQCEDECGLDLRKISGLLQLWIDPEDLAAARFDRVLTTLEAT